ncbi:hypothetical protein CBS101457_002039 [Exobasidium rhododendri]|nr:hypothetical protein CBS101457_002039 [Exobasidium rhododendri]
MIDFDREDDFSPSWQIEADPDPSIQLQTIISKGEEKTLCLNPRQYQMFERAKRENIIACMGTGSGKTLVSVMLLKYVFNEEAAQLQTMGSKCKKRISFFLVNKIPLVDQQAKVIENNSYLKVEKVFGDSSKRVEKSRLAFRFDMLIQQSQCDVIVATAQTVLDALVHDFLKMEDINLIVFDEVHHAIKMDAYARIMQDHYFKSTLENRPKIFGMTASPLKSDGDYQKAIGKLQNMMDARVFTASLELRRELETVCKPPQEQIIEYDAATPMKKGALARKIEAECGHLEGVEKLLGRMAFADQEQGPLMSDLTWLGSSEEIKGRMLRKLEQSEAHMPDTRLLSKEWIQQKAKEATLEKANNVNASGTSAKYIKDAVACSAVNEVIMAHDPIPDLLEVSFTNATPKILKMIEVLKLCGSSPALRRNFCCIMFVERQRTAIALTELLKRMAELKSWLKPEWIIGHNTDQGDGMDPKAQAATLRRFGTAGSTNLLIATNVAEEGLDISPCNCVIRFDLFAHHTGYLQSKGRARSNHSRFIVLLEKENADHYNLVSKVATTDQEITDWLKGLSQEQGAIASMNLEEEECDDADDYSYQLAIHSKTTDACIRPIDCISLVCYYVDLLRKDEFSVPKPEFFQNQEAASGFQTQIRLPANAKIRVVDGPWCSSKKKARRMACFEACKQLYEVNELDENLLPRKIPKVPVVRAALYAKRSRAKGASGNLNTIRRKTPQVYGDGIPRGEFVQGSMTLHAIIVDVQAALADHVTSRPILLLFPSPVNAFPSVEMFTSSSQTIPATKSSVAISLTEAEAKQACLYSDRVLSLIGRQQYLGDKMPYLVLPTTTTPLRDHLLIDKKIIDWVEVGRSAVPLSMKLDYSAFVDAESTKDILVHEYKGVLSQRLYEVLSLINTSDHDDGQGTSSIGTRARTCEGLVDGGPALRCRPILRQGNLLENIKRNDADKCDTLRDIRLASVVACSASFYRSCTVLPSLLYRYDQVLLARELNKDLFGSVIREESLLEALTIPEAHQRINYQILEFFGDGYLKLLACCWAFSKCDSHQEGDLHLECAKKISNKALLQIAIEKELATYASSHTFTQKNWCPPMLGRSREAAAAAAAVEEDKMEDEMEGATEEASGVVFRLPDKGMADIVEAILGAGLASSPSLDLSVVCQCAQKLGILGVDVSTKLQDFQTMFYDVVRPKEMQGSWHARVESGTLARLQEKLQYTFRSPHLALEAVTHSSLLESDLPSYERLEFLGDAVLDFLVVDLIKGKFPNLNEGGYTMIKQNATCNSSLSVLCIESDLHLHSFLLHGSAMISESVAAYKTDLAMAKKAAAEDEGGVYTGNGEDMFPYWSDLKAPKILADVVESMLGAVFVDSGFNLSTAKEYFDKFYRHHFESYFRPETSVVRTPWDFIQFVHYHQCTEWDLLLEDVEGEGEEGEGLADHDAEEHCVLSSLVIHNVVIARRLSRGLKANRIRDKSKQELDNIRKLALTQDLSSQDHRDIKAILQHSLPLDFIRDSVKSSDVDESGQCVQEDFRKTNQITALQSLCTCKRRP